MKAAVVYESMYGTTHSIAQAIAEGLGSAAATEVVSTEDVDRLDVTGLDLLVVGGPTHAHGMTRSQTRQAAVKDAHSGEKELTLDPSAEGPGVREWLDSLRPSSRRAAAFDTRVDMPELLTGHASKGIGKKLKQHGFELVADPESFLVSGDSGLLPGELDRVRLNAISRKKGFSKKALSSALGEAGIRYEHLPVLGNPKDNRHGFWSPGTKEAARAHKTYRELLAAEPAADALTYLAQLARTVHVALLCFEASEACCHRRLILETVNAEAAVLAGA